MKSSSSAPSRFSWRAGVAGSVAFALGGAGLMSAHPAQAAEVNVSDAVFSWGINAESGAGAYYPGSCNFLSAGVAGDAGKADVWSKEDAEAKKLFSPEEGNVKILRPTADGGTQPITWDNKCQTPEGERVNTYNGETAKRSGNFVEISGGKGTIDPETKSGTIEWEGSFTVVYYSGFTYWSVSNPKLEVKNGKGKITGTFSGYGTDMADMTKWEKLKPVEGTIADFGNNKVELDENGFTVTPDYEGVDSGQPDQNKEKDGWGSFPKSWVDYNVQTGQAQYWYSSGGAADPRKKPTALTVKYKAEESEPQVDEETIKNTTKSTHSVSNEGLAVNVTGKGYSVLPKASTGKDANGVYVAVVDRKVKNSEIELSRPSAKAASAAEKSSKEPVAVEYIPGSAIKDGKLNAKVTAGADKLNKDTDYDTVVWVAHGNPNDETVLHRSNINLTDEQKNTLFPAEDPKEQETQDPKDPETQDPQEPTDPDPKEPEANEPGTPDDEDNEPTDPKEPEANKPGTPDDEDNEPTDPKEPEANKPGTPDDEDNEPTDPKEPEANKPGTNDPEVREPEANEPEVQDPEGAPEKGENDKGKPDVQDPEDQKPGAKAPGADKPGAAETSGSHESNAKPSPTASNSLPRTGGTNLAVGIAGITLLAVGAVAMTISRRRP
ncbi:HtaA domain-containing protein [Brevibacterium paucivorans]|uniref:Cell surface protein n=1 Tax=Brevibacterium paucivorans TaxID=170994 RepID=A0A2N6VQB6_9MICO|nr:HtaA domain-containing protein [Brevibacterium paucivorans]PMD06322.1 cell surface protein [Brevibacterium paucivorans]